MNDFEFEQSGWEAFLSAKRNGDVVSAMAFLTMLEEEDDSTVEEAFELLNAWGQRLDVSDLPSYSDTSSSAIRLRQEAEFAKTGIKLELLSEHDPLRLYLEELSMIPAFGDEQLLAEECASGDDSGMLNLTNLGLSSVIELACEYTGRGVLLMDLIQEGSLGLWEGIRSFHGGAYAQHRDRAIRFAMEKAVFLQARSNGVGQKMRQSMQDYRAVDEQLLAQLGRNPTLEEIAEQLHITVEATQAVKKMMDDAYLLQKAQSAGKPEEAEEDPDADQAVEDTAFFQMRQRIQELLSVLDETDSRVLTLRFGLERGLPMSPEETGRVLGMTPEEVVRRETAALMKLRAER